MGINPSSVSPELFALMKRAGFNSMMITPEAGNDGMLRNLDKGFDMQDVRRAARLARASGLHSTWFFMLGGPGETRATVDETLRFVKEEVRAIREHFSGQERLVIGPEATEELCKRHCADYDVLHFATHGHLNKLNPLFSRIDLEPSPEADGRLEVFEIMGLQLHADLAILSACNTAIGSGHFNELPAGDDWVSLTRAFIYAGAPTVIATLWEVDDRSTTELMSEFYRNLPKMSKAHALAQAQRGFLSMPLMPDPQRTAASLRNPYYWAAFVLVGEPQ